MDKLSKRELDNIDRLLVTESNLCFINGDNINEFKLTEDGIVEKYVNNNLIGMFPFSKLGIERESKTLFASGYTLTLNEDMWNKHNALINNNNNNNNDTDKISLDLSNADATKQELQQNIKDVEEITQLKDELDDKLANLMEEDKKPVEPFPSTDFTSEPMLEQDIDVEIFNNELTNEQKAYINTYLGTIDELVKAMNLLYLEVGDGSPMISLDDYIDELLKYDGGIDEWSQELADMLGFELKTENKSKFYTAENMFDDFLKTAKEESDENGYTFKLSDLGLTREDSAEFKNLLLQRDEIEDVTYDPQNNMYTVKVRDIEVKEDAGVEKDSKEDVMHEKDNANNNGEVNK